MPKRIDSQAGPLEDPLSQSEVLHKTGCFAQVLQGIRASVNQRRRPKRPTPEEEEERFDERYLSKRVGVSYQEQTVRCTLRHEEPYHTWSLKRSKISSVTDLCDVISRYHLVWSFYTRRKYWCAYKPTYVPENSISTFSVGHFLTIHRSICTNG